MRKIYVMFNNSFAGDKAQSKAIADAIAALNPDTQIIEADEVEWTTEEHLQEKVKEFKSNDCIIAAGGHGLTMINHIKSFFKKNGARSPLTLYSGHQYFSEFEKIDHYPDIIGLPQATLLQKQIEAFQKKSVFVPLLGVPHTVTPQSIEQDCKKFAGKIPDLTGKSVVGIVLGGDAPDYKKNVNFFTPDDARKRAGFIIADLKKMGRLDEKTILLVTNGPRTGQYDPTTQMPIDPNPHKVSGVDKVSTAFLDELKKLLKEYSLSESQISFYNFNFTLLPSAYKPLLSSIVNHKGTIYIPAESTSMVSESEYVSRRGGAVIVYSISSENEEHTKNNKYWFDAGMINLLDAKGIHHTAAVQPKYADCSDAELIAREATDKLKLPLSSSPLLIYNSTSSASTSSSSSSSFENTVISLNSRPDKSPTDPRH